MEIRFDSLPGLVARPKLVPERLHHVIGRDGKMGCPILKHPEHRPRDTQNGAHFVSIPISRRGQGKEMTVELVGSVDQVNPHRRRYSKPAHGSTRYFGTCDQSSHPPWARFVPTNDLMRPHDPIMIVRDPDDPEERTGRPGRAKWVLASLAGLGVLALVTALILTTPAEPIEEPALPTLDRGSAIADTLRTDEPLGTFLARQGVDSKPALAAMALAEVDPDLIPDGSLVTVRRVAGSETTEIAFHSDEDHRVSIRSNAGRWTARREAIDWTTSLTVIAGRFGSDMAAEIDSSGIALGPSARRDFVTTMANALAWQIDAARGTGPLTRFRAVTRVGQSSDGQQRVRGIQALEIDVRGRPFFAYRFSSSSNGSFAYFDERGRPLGRSFLRAPLASSRGPSSTFMIDRVHPVLGTVRAHRGVDYPAPEGTPVLAAASGIVRFAGPGEALGNFIVVEHGRGVSTRYGHLNRIASGIEAGAQVRKGAVIGYVGQTGLATAPHLHYEFRVRGTAIDMRLLDVDPESPVEPLFRAAFDNDQRGLRALLDR